MFGGCWDNNMDAHETVNSRILSEESVRSSIMSSVSDDYVYYHTEIFDQLPSSQAARPQQARPGEQGACKSPEERPNAGEKFCHSPFSGGARDKAYMQPPKNLAVPMQERREAWEWRKMEYEREKRTIGYWESWRRSQSINRKRVWANMGEALLNLLPWRNVLHTIESRFGVGVNAYFVFLRYLLCLNLLHCVIISAFILGPTTFYGRGNSSESLNFNDNDSVIDFFLGTGILQRSPVFYSFYTRGSLKLPCLNTSLLYLSGILTLLFLSLILVVRRMVVGYKHSRLLGNSYHDIVSYKVFCGWDFNIQDPDGARIKKGIIRNDLKLYLGEQSFCQREAGRTTGQWVRLYLLRMVLNLLVLTLLAGAFYLIYSTVTLQREEQQPQRHNWLVSLIVEYLPAMVFTLVNLTLPHIFRRISFSEDYSLTMQVNVTLVRSIFLKLASLGIYMFSLFSTCLEQKKCPENQFGKEIYKFMVFDFLTCFCETFLVNLPRMLLQKRYPESCLGQLASKNYFPITQNVLNQVSNQTLLWVGVYYCPLLPFFGTVKLAATFYMKKFCVLRCCVPKQKVFRASSSSVLFHFMLLLGLTLAAASLGLALHQFSLSSTCGRGPFGGGSSAYNVTGVCVDSLPRPAQNVLRYLYSEAFAMTLILAEIVILTSYVSRGQANQKTIDRLKDMLVMASSDKRFLVKQHTTLLRQPRKTPKTIYADTE